MGRGRPKKHIDRQAFEDLCSIHCTLPEIAFVLHVSEDTVERWSKEQYGMNFAEAYKMVSAPGNISLRRWQVRSAKNGNVTMQIWLGKQWLGQTDKVETKNETMVEENTVVLYLPDDGRESRNAG